MDNFNKFTPQFFYKKLAQMKYTFLCKKRKELRVQPHQGRIGHHNYHKLKKKKPKINLKSYQLVGGS